MIPIQLKIIEKPITIHFPGKKVNLPEPIRQKIDDHWQELVKNNPRLHNGEAFTMLDIKETSSGINIELAGTNYAHYLYSHQIGGLGTYDLRIIHSAALVITSDNKMVFGAMGEHTSRPGIIQCCGGGIDHNDIHDNIVDLEHNTASELNEELGIDPYDKERVKSFKAIYLKVGGPTGKMTVIYILRLRQTAKGFLKSYNLFAQNLLQAGEDPEFGEIFELTTNSQAVQSFIEAYSERLDEYMAELLRVISDKN